MNENAIARDDATEQHCDPYMLEDARNCWTIGTISVNGCPPFERGRRPPMSGCQNRGTQP